MAAKPIGLPLVWRPAYWLERQTLYSPKNLCDGHQSGKNVYIGPEKSHIACNGHCKPSRSGAPRRTKKQLLSGYQFLCDEQRPSHADWLGWKQRGRYLVSPDGQRINPERMCGIMWRMDAEARRDAARARNAKAKVSQGCVKVVVMELADLQARHFGSRAG